MLYAMHIPDGFLHPLTALVTAALSFGAIGYSLRRLRLEAGDRLVPLVGVTAAGIFAAQMVNFPLGVVPASGHLTGGVLAAVVLGPWAAAVAMTCVLIVQCFLFGDGGVTALGANALNMAVIGPLLGYSIYALIRTFLKGEGGRVAAAMFSAWLIVPISAVAFAMELAAGGEFRFLPVATAMLLFHLLIGVGEALITGVVLAWIVRTRPTMLYEPQGGTGGMARTAQMIVGGLALAAAVAVLVAPWSSNLEDGLQAVAVRLDFSDRGLVAEPVIPVPFPDYAFSDSGNADSAAASSGRFWQRARLVTAVVGLLGTLVTFGAAMMLAGSVRMSYRRSGPVHVG